MNFKIYPFKIIFTYLIILIVELNIHAQEIPNIVSYYTNHDGLSNSYVMSAATDKYGFLWFGTADGLNRFDGYNFKVYKPNLNRSGSITNKVIRKIIASSDNNLWIAGNATLNQYDYEHDTFKEYNNPNNLSGIYEMYEDTKHNLWIYYENNDLAFFDVNKKIYMHFSLASILKTPNTPKLNTGNIYIDNKNKLWHSYRINLKVYLESLSIDSFYNTKKVTFRKHLSETFLETLLNDGKGNLWASSGSDLYLYMPDADKFVLAKNKYSALNSLTNMNITCINESEPGILYMGTNLNGVFKFDIKNSKVEQILKNQNQISSINCDLFNDLWISTDNGICKFNLKPKLFYLANNELLLNDNNVTAVTEINGKIAVSNKKGLIIINSNQKTQLFNEDKINKQNALITNSINHLFTLNKNTIIASGVGLTKIDIDKNRFEYSIPIEKDSQSLPVWVEWHFHQGQKTGNYWICTSTGLSMIKKEDMNLTINSSYSRMKEKIYNYPIINKTYPDLGWLWCSFEDKNGIVYIGSNNKGLIVFNPETNAIRNFQTNINLKSTISNNNISSLHIDKNNIVWIGTEGGGLNRFDPKTELFQTFSFKEGLSSDVIYGILEDDENNLWMSSNNGLMRFNKNTNKIHSYTNKDGLQNNEFKRNAYFKANDEKLYFGGIDGLTYFYPHEIKENNTPPKVFLTNLNIYNHPINPGDTINGEVILKKSIMHTDTISISHKNNYFSIDFVALHYTNSNSNKYTYQLKGFDKNPIEVQHDHRSAYYTNLPAGKYLFEVNASNSDGLWSKNNCSVLVIIKPPFWKTWWFNSIIAFLLIISIYGFYRYRLNSIKKKNEELKVLVNERTHELEIKSKNLLEANDKLIDQKEEITAQANKLDETNHELQKLNNTKDRLFSIIGHDLKNPLSGIYTISELLKNNYTDYSEEKFKELIDILNSSSEKSYNLLQNILDWAKSQSKSVIIKIEATHIKSIINEVYSLLRINADSKCIKLTNNISDNFYVLADKNMITTVIRNLVNNSIKFCHINGEIIISGYSNDNKNIVSIIDNGVGINKERLERIFDINHHNSTFGTSGETGTGLGLIICKEFIEANGGTFNVTSIENKGTQFNIYLPIPSESDILSISDSNKYIESENLSTLNINITTSPEIEISNAIEGKDKKVILVVEDDDAIRNTIISVIEKEYSVFSSVNGKKGLEVAIKEVPDVIISDLMMPEMDGFGFISKIRSNEITNHIPFIMLTSNDLIESKVSGFEKGVDDYLIKPFNPLVLKARLANIIELRENLKNKYSQSFTLDPENISIDKIGASFLEKIKYITEELFENSDFNTEMLSEKMNMSRSQLFRKMKNSIGIGPNDFIREFRLKKAANLLQAGNLNISEVSYAVGFLSHSYFTKIFNEKFGMNPAEYILKNKK